MQTVCRQQTADIQTASRQQTADSRKTDIIALKPNRLSPLALVFRIRARKRALLIGQARKRTGLLGLLLAVAVVVNKAPIRVCN